MNRCAACHDHDCIDQICTCPRCHPGNAADEGPDYCEKCGARHDGYCDPLP